MAERETILVIDPSDPAGRIARVALQLDGRAVLHCANAQEGLALAQQVQPDVVVAALDTVDLPGLRMVEALRSKNRTLPVIALAGTATVEGAVQALRAGAADYIGRPISPGLLSQKVVRALQEVRAARQLASARATAKDRYGFTQLLSQSPKMTRVFDAVRSVAGTDATVLIRGETGTGKELVARAIHERSRRREKPLIGVNCGAFTETLLESELFGHEKGSFTGALGRRQGVFEMADGGSLFLDELGETSLSVQVNLLRVLEDMTFRRVGGTESVKVDVRIIAATNVALEVATKDGRFREDLYYRLNVFPVFLPPLRDRVEDIPLLLHHFLQDAAEEYELPIPSVTPESLDRIVAYRWPGNVRQLRAMCERWVILCNGAALTVDLMPRELANSQDAASPTGLYIDDTIPLPQLTQRYVTQIERAYLHKLLARNHGKLIETAEMAGITRRTLYTRMKEFGLDVKDYK